MAFSLYICLNPTLGCLWTVSSLFYFWICWYAERVPPLSTQAANNRACAQERQLPPCNCCCSPEGQGCHHVYCGNNEGSDGNTSLKASLVRSCPIYRLYSYSLFLWSSFMRWFQKQLLGKSQQHSLLSDPKAQAWAQLGYLKQCCSGPHLITVICTSQ